MLIMLLSQALSEWFGDTGVLLLSGLSGLSDVDPITLTLGRQSPAQITPQVAMLGIYIAASANSLVKMLMVITIAHPDLAKQTAPAMLTGIGLGAAMMYFS